MFDSNALLMSLSEQKVEVEKLTEQKGGNSRIYKFLHNKRMVILKVYLGEEKRIKASRNREKEAYRFLTINGFQNLPTLVEDLNISDGICLEYIGGVRPEHNQQTNQEILNSFLQLRSIFEKNQTFEKAIDAAFSTNDVLEQIESRIEQFEDSLNGEKAQLAIVLDMLRLKEPVVFQEKSMTYSFSDVGPHNMMWSRGKFFYLDLEFFGRDSAAKMILDYLLHPRNKAFESSRIQNLKFAERHFGFDFNLAIACVPFFAAKWATIVARRMNLSFREQNIHHLKSLFMEYVELAKLESNSDIHAKLNSTR